MVAPSFVTVMSPSGDIRILSRPRGPYNLYKYMFTNYDFEPYQRSLDDVRHCSCGQNVGLDCLVAVLPLLFALTIPPVSPHIAHVNPDASMNSPHTL